MPPHTPATTLDSSSTGRRWSTAVAFCLSAALGLAGTSAADAATDPPAPDDAQAASAAANPQVVDFPMSRSWIDRAWRYGEDLRDGGPSAVMTGPNTHTLLFDVSTEPLGSVVCRLINTEDDVPDISLRWTAEQWSSTPRKTFAVQNPEYYDLARCESGADDEQNWRIWWEIGQQREDAGEVVVLTNDEREITASFAANQYNSPGPVIPVFPNAKVRLSGPPGTWPQTDDVRVRIITDAAPDPRRDNPPVIEYGADVSADGSTVWFGMVGEYSTRAFGPNARLEVKAYTRTAGYPPHTEVTSFRTPLVVVAQPRVAPAAVVSLSSRYTLSSQRVTATAGEYTPGFLDSTTAIWTATFAVNGKSVGTVPLDADGMATFRLPAFDRGRYSVTATFTPSDSTPSVVSPAVRLRVVR